MGYNMLGKLMKLLFIINFLFNKITSNYNMTFATKLRLVFKIFRNCKHPNSASSFMENMFLAKQVLSIPNELPGNIAEFGSYKGISSANLSLLCKVTKRKLYIFDSFLGLPEPKEKVRGIMGGKVIEYKKGDYMGTIGEVRKNITNLGEIGVCEIVSGYFEESLAHFPKNEKFVMIFEDADLPSSIKTVLKYAWPLLQEGCYFFSHEARDREAVKIFFDDDWWKKTLKCESPGLVGSGTGLPLEGNLGRFDGLAGSHMGYVIKKS
jgi:O-methyltransferase